MGALKLLYHPESKPLKIVSCNFKEGAEKKKPFSKSGVNYYPYGKILRQYANGATERYLTTQHERDVETGLDYRGARFYDSDIGRFLSLDPLAADYPSLSDYCYVAGNPMRFIDPTGTAVQDNIYIATDGTMEIEKTDDNYNRYYFSYNDSEGNELAYFIGQFDKNESGLIQLPSTFSYSNQYTTFSFTVKEGNEYRAYISGEALGAFFGAMADSKTENLTVVGFSASDGSSPSPSSSHINGKNGDLRYLRNDNSGGSLYLDKHADDLDEKRQNRLNNALYKYGWTDQLSYEYTVDGEKRMLDRTRPYPDHHHHLHLQGFKPKTKVVTDKDPILVGGSLPIVEICPN